jgi:periplasmic protein TonB
MGAVMGKNPQSNMFWPVCFSLAIHIALVAAVIAGLSGHWNFSAATNRLNLVWVSLETKNPGNVPAMQHRSENKLPSVEKIITPTANPVTHAKKEEPIKTTAQAEPTGSGVETKYTAAVQHNTKTYSANSTGGTALMAATDQLSFGLANAYPRYRENKPPVYPETARARGYEGIVFVTAEVLMDGNVGRLNINKSSGYAVLDTAALEAVKHWKFEPARKMGKPCASKVNLPIRFDIRDENSQS